MDLSDLIVPCHFGNDQFDCNVGMHNLFLGENDLGITHDNVCMYICCV